MTICSFIKDCQKAYYSGNPIISNEEYDALIKRFPYAEEEIGESGEILHAFRMYSLQKVYPGRGDKFPLEIEDCVETIKLDGCAVSLLYINGSLVQGLTRGNGVKGKDKLANIRAVDGVVPLLIGKDVPPIVQITGEVCVTKDVENRRNFASGAINTNSKEEFNKKAEEGGLVFIAYGLQVNYNSIGYKDSFVEDMKWIHEISMGNMLTVLTNIHTNNIPTDGIVYRLNNNKDFFSLGWTNKHPRGAFAVKEDDDYIVTTLLDVIWQVGASGKVTPVAILDPVIIDDASISKATLNNVAYMRSMGITDLGIKVRVIRAGGVIPKIVGVEI